MAQGISGISIQNSFYSMYVNNIYYVEISAYVRPSTHAHFRHYHLLRAIVSKDTLLNVSTASNFPIIDVS